MALTPDTAEQVFNRAHAEDRLAHAYLITGPSGVGKVDLARKLTRLILGQPSGDPFAHADFHRIEPESKSRRIVIEQVRELEQALQMRSLFGGKKVGMILDAERLQPQAHGPSPIASYGVWGLRPLPHAADRVRSLSSASGLGVPGLKHTGRTRQLPPHPTRARALALRPGPIPIAPALDPSHPASLAARPL